MAASERQAGGVAGLAGHAIVGWALLGGGLLLLVVAMNVISVVGAVFGAPFPGDFELTEVGVAVAVFAFLPYCQLKGANVTADIFTSGASSRSIAVFTLIGAVVALLFSLILVWRMYAGMQDQKEYEYTTAILQFPHWVAFLPILVSLALLAVAALVTIVENVAVARQGTADV